jgi:CHAD domain-containing protein
LARFASGNAIFMAETLQREGTWEVSDAFVLPNIEGVVVDAELHRESTESVGAYYDTADLDLVARGITLRRHDYGDRCRWRLAMPTGAPSIELTSKSTGLPPAELTRLLTAVTSGKELGDVVSVRTARELYRISRREDEDFYAVLVDDRVFASTADRLAVRREVEVGVGQGIGTIPVRLARRLEAAGARPARRRSDLEHVLPALRMTHAPPARQAMARYLNDQIDAVVSGDIGLRRGVDPIHDTRVAIRRIRSTLRVFAKSFQGAAAAELESELKWFAALLGEVRDCQVLRERFSKALNGFPDELMLGPIRSGIPNTLLGIERPARRRVSDAMDSERYLALMAVLRQWRTEVPTSRASGEDELRKRCRKARRKADRRLLAAVRSDDERALHAARKAAKRARYAGELLGTVQPEVLRKAKGYRKIQSVLGDHQDTVVARDMLRRMAAGTGPALDQNGLTFGLLHANEQLIADETHSKAAKLAKKGYK